MQISQAALEAIYYNFRLLFDDAYAITPTWSDKLSTVVPSSSREQRYPWIQRIPRMREWIGERKLNNLVASNYSLINKTWEQTIELDVNDIKDDNIGLYNQGMQQMGQAAKKWADDVMLGVLQGGTSALGFDGVPFFSASHPVSDGTGGVYSNNYTGTALTATNVQAVRSAMMGLKGENGKSLLVQPSLLVVPPALESTARQILNAEFIAPAAAFGQNAAGGFQTNVLKGVADLLVVPELAGADTTWYLADVTKPIKPFVWQLREAPVMVTITDPASENVFKTRKFLYGTTARGNGGYSLPFLAARAIA